jgi:hypothetical protein
LQAGLFFPKINPAVLIRILSHFLLTVDRPVQGVPGLVGGEERPKFRAQVLLAVEQGIDAETQRPLYERYPG